MSWQAYCRELSKDYDKCYVCSFPGMESLYEDFATFIPHSHKGRALQWTDISMVDYEIPDDVIDHIKPLKQYRLEGDFIQFGSDADCDDQLRRFKVLVHARGIRRGVSKNYPLELWEEVIGSLSDVASIGSAEDLHVPGTFDLRGIPLDLLMREMAVAKVIVGGSSGVMHLASLCGTPHVVWGDRRTYFGETLDVRYKKTWNPLGTLVEFIFDDNWRPVPEEVIEVTKRMLNGQEDSKMTELKLDAVMEKALKKAAKSRRWLMALCYIRPDGDIQHVWQTHKFPKDDIPIAIEGMKRDIYAKECLRDNSDKEVIDKEFVGELE